MKLMRVFVGMLAAAGMLAVASCSDDEQETTIQTDDDVRINYIGSEAELTAAASAGGSCMLISDVELSTTISVTASDITLDLNGYSITRNSTGTYYLEVYREANLTLSDGSDGATGSFSCQVVASMGGELTIKGCTFSKSVTCWGGTMTIEDGTFDKDVICRQTIGITTITGGTFNGDLYAYSGTIIIEGGTFYGIPNTTNGTISISGGTFYDSEFAASGATIADGCTVTTTTDAEGNVCYVVK